MQGSRGHTRGFTLMEVLVVLGIIAILATTAIVAINPARQFAQARNVQRIANIHEILNAIGGRLADNNGLFAGGGCSQLPSATTSIDDGPGGSGVDLTTNCLVPAYIPELPHDPADPAPPKTGYQVRVDSLGRVILCAPLAATEISLAHNPPALCVMR